MKNIFITLSLLLGCKPSTTSQELLTLKRENINPINFKLNGYYYCYFNNQATKEVFIFYKNSIFIDMGGFENNTFAEVEASFSSEWFITQQLGKRQSIYGLFKIENEKLTIEQWKNDGLQYRVVTKKATIFNDSTFQITSISSYNGSSNVSSENRIYHFRQYSPKPDSTNSFIP
jgi:hypothetical protein